MTFTDCTWKFCPPSELDLIAMNAARTPGILEVVFPDEYNVCLVYDPTQLKQAEVVQAFESSTGLKVGEILP
jgi:hypothetical protein